MKSYLGLQRHLTYLRTKQKAAKKLFTDVQNAELPLPRVLVRRMSGLQFHWKKTGAAALCVQGCNGFSPFPTQCSLRAAVLLVAGSRRRGGIAPIRQMQSLGPFHGHPLRPPVLLLVASHVRLAGQDLCSIACALIPFVSSSCAAVWLAFCACQTLGTTRTHRSAILKGSSAAKKGRDLHVEVPALEKIFPDGRSRMWAHEVIPAIVVV